MWFSSCSKFPKYLLKMPNKSWKQMQTYGRCIQCGNSLFSWQPQWSKFEIGVAKSKRSPLTVPSVWSLHSIAALRNDGFCRTSEVLLILTSKQLSSSLVQILPYILWIVLILHRNKAIQRVNQLKVRTSFIAYRLVSYLFSVYDADYSICLPTFEAVQWWTCRRWVV